MMAGNQASPQRSDAEAIHEQVMQDVADVLLNLEHTISRARKARLKALKFDEGRSASLALDDAIAVLEKTRQRLMQDAYYRQEELRLI